MTIYSRFGGECEIVGKDPRWPDVPWLAIRWLDPPHLPARWASVADLKATGGIQEISLAAERAPIAVYAAERAPIILERLASPAGETLSGPIPAPHDPAVDDPDLSGADDWPDEFGGD